MGEWISVKDRLPEQCCKVLIAWKLNDKMEVDMAIWTGVVPKLNVTQYEITHWMPLPEPPKEG